MKSDYTKKRPADPAQHTLQHKLHINIKNKTKMYLMKFVRLNVNRTSAIFIVINYTFSDAEINNGKL